MALAMREISVASSPEPIISIPPAIVHDLAGDSRIVRVDRVVMRARVEVQAARTGGPAPVHDPCGVVVVARRLAPRRSRAWSRTRREPNPGPRPRSRCDQTRIAPYRRATEQR